jgi:DNA-binding NarL/FixJ family response regulator
MEIVQLAISSSSYATALRELLSRNAGWKVLSVEAPDLCMEGVVVLDAVALGRLSSQIPNPERIVLITQNDPQHLARAWEAGIVSVVFGNDPINTAMLAIMAARLRVAKTARHDAGQAVRDSLV